MIDAVSGTETRYREMLVRINAFAGALASRGISVGDVVGLLAPNSSSFAIALHGILRAGATATTINALFTIKDIAKQLTDSRAKMLVTVTSSLRGLSPLELVVLDGHGEAATGHPNAADLLGPQYQAPKLNFDSTRHLAVLPYSSGTTGEPKGVMLTHRNVVANPRHRPGRLSRLDRPLSRQ